MVRFSVSPNGRVRVRVLRKAGTLSAAIKLRQDLEAEQAKALYYAAVGDRQYPTMPLSEREASEQRAVLHVFRRRPRRVSLPPMDEPIVQAWGSFVMV